uniref:Uncharacterized protein n=1 Tax=Timema poppense TaxID=170557 RepID=A0A7R9DRV3_TIMPO|nr:unnamed protein product [Timema poppensis]
MKVECVDQQEGVGHDYWNTGIVQRMTFSVRLSNAAKKCIISRATQAINNLKPQLFVGSRKTVNTIARLYSSRPIASNQRDTRKEDKEWITEERLNQEEETLSNEFVGNRRENEQAHIIHDIVTGGGCADWKAITEEVLSKGNMINSSSIHAVIMNACCSHKKT